jgi:hypothetical protein
MHATADTELRASNVQTAMQLPANYHDRWGISPGADPASGSRVPDSAIRDAGCGIRDRLIRPVGTLDAAALENGQGS